MSQFATYHGEQIGPAQALSLPAALLRLQIVLPPLSEPGDYSVVVSTNESRRQVVALGHGSATSTDDRVILVVTLNLREAKPGDDVLSTERKGGGTPYFYPVKVQ